jgi:hypothetical protein
MELAERTPAGMAHYAGTGPAGTTCETCGFFMGTRRTSGIGQGRMQPGRCREFMRIMRQHHGMRAVPVHKVPPETASCRHYKSKV